MLRSDWLPAQRALSTTVHCISVTSQNTYVSPYMEINAANVAWHKISFINKKLDGKKFAELSTEEIQEITANAIP